MTCAATMAELRDIGRLPREEGVRACGELVRVPVIHREVAEALWDCLAAGQWRVDGEEYDQQEGFEREVVACMAEERDEKMVEDGERGGACREPCCVFCEGRAGRTCQLPADTVLQRDPREGTGGLSGVLWQREETVCPCQKTYEDAGEGHMSDDHGSDSSAGQSEAGMSSASASTSTSTRSSLSQMFAWGRRS